VLPLPLPLLFQLLLLLLLVPTVGWCFGTYCCSADTADDTGFKTLTLSAAGASERFTCAGVTGVSAVTGAAAAVVVSSACWLLYAHVCVIQVRPRPQRSDDESKEMCASYRPATAARTN
jgi:hypothetical protein